jgi:glycerol-3-phosphate dehydrogenase
LSKRGAEIRERSLELLSRRSFDLLVIGGGIVGSRVALEASRAGLRVALVDAGDFGGATSSASGKLVHGGLRYLRAGRFRLVRAALRERRLLATRIAPHLVRPIPLVLATEEAGWPRHLMVAAGPLAYWALGGLCGPAPRLSGVGPPTASLPALRTGGPCGLVEEAVTDDGRLTLATVKAAVRAGTVAANHVRVAELRRHRGGISGAVLVGREGEGIFDLRCRAVVNATGPWLDRVRLLEDPKSKPATRLSKGAHLVLPLEGEWPVAIALTLRDGRHVYGVPWHGMLLIGTTDTLHEGDPGSVAPTPAEETYLLEAAARLLSGEQAHRERVLCSFAGLRVLRPGHGPTSDASREHLVVVGPAGMVSVAGGKLTTHRLIALDALRALPSGVRPRRLRPDLDPLPGSSPPDQRVLRSRLDAATARHLTELYGGEAAELLRYSDRFPDALERVHPAGPDLWAQVRHAAEEEWAMTVEDVARRRTTLAIRGLDTGIARVGISAVLGEGWPGLRPVTSGTKSFSELRPS